MMNKVISRGLTIAVILCICAFNRSYADIVMKVDVTNKTVSMVAVVYQTTIVEIPLDEKGHGEYTFRHIGAVHADLFYGMESRKVFLEDGDVIHVSFDGARFKEDMKWKVQDGKEKIYNYLNQVKLSEFTEDKYALPFDEFVAFIGKKEEAALKILKAWKLDKVSPRFVTVETGRIRYAYSAAVLMYAAGHPFVAQDSLYRPDEAYYDEIKRRAVEDANLVELKDYREYMKEIAHIFGCPKGQARTPYERTVCMMEYVADNIDNDTVKQTLLNVLAIEQVEQYGVNNIDELTNLYNTFVTDDVLREAFKEKCDAWDLTKPGKSSPDFRAFDAEGKSYSVADFKGKYLYIDLWATWCGPCRREMPFLKQLESDFEGRNITFLSLSTDARKADWLKVVQGQEMTGVQLFLGKGSRFQTAYKAEGIPHFILLDPEGKIVNANMLRPSSADIRGYLERLPGM